MKIKVGKDYQNTLSTNYMRDWMMQLYNNKEIEIIVNRDDFADIGINTNINVTLSFYINFSDPHSLSFYDINNLINQKWTNLIKDKNKLINYSLLNINNNCSIEKINTYNYYAPIVYDCSTHLIDKIKAKLIHWNHSLPQDIFFINTKIKRINDVYFSGSIRENSYPLRKLIYDEIKQHFEIKSIINNVSGIDVKNFAKKDTNDDISKQNEKYKLQLINYAGNLRLSKLTLFDGGIFDYPVKKFYESMACGCLVLAPKPLDADYLGFIDNETYVQIDENNFMDKVKFYLNNDKERERITKNAYNLYLERFTIEKDVEKFINFCKQELNNITNTEKDSKYYDRIYLKSQLASGKYSASVSFQNSPYTELYNKVLQVINKDTDNIIELGCGTGTFAEYLIANNYNYIIGTDFSQVAIDICKKRFFECFECKDIFDFDLSKYNYNTIISLEVLEHINKDIELIKKIPKNTKFIFSVPNFKDVAHVRYFSNEAEIINRYSKYLTINNIYKIPKNSTSRIVRYVVDSIIK